MTTCRVCVFLICERKFSRGNKWENVFNKEIITFSSFSEPYIYWWNQISQSSLELSFHFTKFLLNIYNYILNEFKRNSQNAKILMSIFWVVKLTVMLHFQPYIFLVELQYPQKFKMDQQNAFVPLSTVMTLCTFVLFVDDVIFSLCAGSRRDYECLLSFHKHTYVINIDWNISHFHTSRICIHTS